MIQQRPYLRKPVKSLSARTFSKSARKPANRRNDTLHTATQPIEMSQTVRQRQFQGNTSRLLFFPKKSGPFYKPQQQLAEQNHTLKIKIHQLNTVLGKERSKNGLEKKNYSKVHQRLQAQFSDEKYFDLASRNNNLVEGVKFQYYKMKQNYEDKCKQYEALLKRTQTSNEEENAIFIEALQMENKKLKNKMVTLVAIEQKLSQQLKKKRVVSESDQFNKKKSEQDQPVYELLDLSVDFMILEKKVIDCEQKIEKYQQKINALKTKAKERRKKIDFLDRLLIYKSNQVHRAVIKQRRMAKQLNVQTLIVDKLRKKVTQMEEDHQASIEMIKEKERVRFQAEKNIFSTSLKEKDAQIQRLKQEVYYLSTIISYIKTGEDPFRLDSIPTNLSKKNSYKEHSSQFLQNLQKNLIQIEGDSLSTRKRVKTLIQSGFKETDSPRQGNTQNLKIIQIVSDSQYQVESIIGSLLRNSQLEQAFETRVPKKSNLKHSEGAVKVRPVKPSQVDNLKKQLVYRFMFYGLPIDQVKELLTCTEEVSWSKRQKKWRAQYATLKEIKEKLQAYPFDLKQEEALLLSRYIVQDCTKEVVYYHEDNEVERTIAKSILRAFVGDYHLPVQADCKLEIKSLLGSSGKNLQSALTSLAPTGFISSLKFCEISQSIQVDFSEDARNYILSRLLARSKEGLSNLEYGLIFTTLIS